MPATTATPAPPADAGPETFDGTIDIEPASRTIALNAGDALKVRVVGSEAATDDFAIGIAPAGDVVDQWATYGYFSDDDYFENSEFYSDFRGDDGWMQYAYEYGPVIQFTQYQSPNDYFSDDSLYDSPPEFFVGGRGWGSAENGSWVMFVAPTTGSYNVILTGHGPFQVTLDTQPTAVVPEGAPEATNPFDASAPQDPVPFDSQLWADVIRSHLDWFFDGGTFGPAESYYSDYFSDDQYTPGEDEVYGPTPELRAEIEALLGSAMG